MRKVLHVGPCDTPGGMATVMHTLAEFPPEGWEAELLASHAPGGLWAKWRAYRRARRELKRRCSDPALRPDVVHVHTAADWSWRRKARLIGCLPVETGVVIHIHSGKFDAWLGKAESKRSASFMKTVQQTKSTVVVLSEAWKEALGPIIGDTLPISNPIPLNMVPSNEPRERDHLLLMGRPDPVKGHDFAIKVAQRLHQERPSLRLSLTGIEDTQHDFVHALGWVVKRRRCVYFKPLAFFSFHQRLKARQWSPWRQVHVACQLWPSSTSIRCRNQRAPLALKLNNGCQPSVNFWMNLRSQHRSMLMTILQKFNINGTNVIAPNWVIEEPSQGRVYLFPKNNASLHKRVLKGNVAEVLHESMWKALLSIHPQPRENPP